MNDPAAYPPNDAAEHRAIALFESVIDPNYVKSEIRKRDKFPNIDGFIEVVSKRDGKLIPIAKLDVQIKKLPKDALSFSCPSTLVAYSTMGTTLPALLICADPDTHRVFWKHIHRTMPEYKENQDSFTVKFDPEVDAIDSTNTYIRRWTEIANEYQIRISSYPELKNQVEDRYGLNSVKPADVRYFQEFIDHFNYLASSAEFVGGNGLG